MAKTDLVATIKKDLNGLGQRTRCGGCLNPLAQGGDFKAYEIKGRTFPDGETAEGILCQDCQQFENKVKEGPLLAIRLEGPNEDEPREYQINNLPLESQGDEPAITGAGQAVMRSADGKIKPIKGKGAEESFEGTGLEPGLTRPEIEAKKGSRREK